MKKIILMMLLLAAGAGTYAQVKPVRPDRTQLPKALQTQLKLTAAQQTKVTAILQSKKMQMDSIMAKAKTAKHVNGRLLGKKMQSVNTESDDKLYAVFNEDQKHVYAQWLLDRRVKFAKPRPAPVK